MTVRPVFVPVDRKPYYKRIPVEFEFSPGLAPAQKQKNSAALHDAYLKRFPHQKVMEVSTKSQTEEGKAASPFNLKLELPYLKKAFCVENIYQAAKVFEQGGPYVDLLGTTPLAAKRDERLQNSGKLLHYRLDDQQFPSYPGILFYTWLYVNALIENPRVAQSVLEADAFTDIEFNPEGQVCQALGCAIYKGLKKNHRLSEPLSFEEYKKFFLDEDISEIPQRTPPPKPQARPVPKPKKTTFAIGEWLDHPNIGKGEVVRRDSRTYTINFRVAGPRTLSRDYVETFCRKLN